MPNRLFCEQSLAMRRNLQSDEFELWRVLEDSFENCTDFMAGLKLELGEPTILNESVDLAQCYFKIAAEILGMLRIITPMLTGA